MLSFHSPAQHYYGICRRAHMESPSRSTHAVPLPEWLSELAPGRSSLLEVFSALEASLLLMVNQQHSCELLLPRLASRSAQSLASRLKELRDVTPYQEGPAHVLEQCIHKVADVVRYADRAIDPQDMEDAALQVHRLLTQACGQNGRAVTPPDVAELLCFLASPSTKLDVHPSQGLGIHLGTRSTGATRLAYELWRPPLASEVEVYRREFFASTEIDRAELCAMGFESLFHEFGPTPAAERGSALIVNAANSRRPFGEENRLKNLPKGKFNDLFELGYEHLVVLVQNDVLTGGRKTAEELFSFCVARGLRRVIQLPNGVLGPASSVHSVLIFDRSTCRGSIEFVVIERIDEPLTGFGHARRHSAMRRGIDLREQSEHWLRAERTSVTSWDALRQRPKANVSFEAQQFVQETPTLPGFHCIKLKDIASVFRSHHIPNYGEGKVERYLEVGLQALDSMGDVDPRSCVERQGEQDWLRNRSPQVLQRGDILICFRGSRDALGKVALVRHTAELKLIPNQSFVIIRMNPDRIDDPITPEYLHWWLQSEHANAYISANAIYPSVPRIAPSDLKQMPVPIGPPGRIAQYLNDAREYETLLAQRRKLQLRIRDLLDSSWNAKPPDFG